MEIINFHETDNYCGNGKKRDFSIRQSLNMKLFFFIRERLDDYGIDENLLNHFSSRITKDAISYFKSNDFNFIAKNIIERDGKKFDNLKFYILSNLPDFQFKFLENWDDPTEVSYKSDFYDSLPAKNWGKFAETNTCLYKTIFEILDSYEDKPMNYFEFIDYVNSENDKNGSMIS